MAARKKKIQSRKEALRLWATHEHINAMTLAGLGESTSKLVLSSRTGTHQYESNYRVMKGRLGSVPACRGDR
jgi:hypothetical protein